MRYILISLSLIAPLPAFAGDVCNDAWFSRNLVMDRAGYCFGSVLGQELFDNTGCTGKNVTLSADDQVFVSRMRALEKQNQCSVDTKSPYLELGDAWVRRQLATLPITDGFESACLGWLHTPEPLRSAAYDDAPIIATILPGDNVSFGHLPNGTWDYVTISGPDWVVKGGGWLKAPGAEGRCANYAG